MNKLLATLLLALSATCANATVITFNHGAGHSVYTGTSTPSYDDSHIWANSTSWSEAGFNVTMLSGYAHTHGYYTSNEGIAVDYGGYTLQVDKGGEAFDLNSFITYAKFGDWVVTGSNGATALLGADHAYDTVLHSFSSAFAGITSFTLSGGYSTIDLDNITLSESVPEPASLALAAFGLLGLGLSRRKAAGN